MPLYEYRCLNCGKRSSFLRQIGDISIPACPHCGHSRLVRVISRVSVLRSEESRLEDLPAPHNFGDVDENDPKSMARWMKKMGQEMGEDLGPEFDEMVERMESGQSPEEIEESLGSQGDQPPS
ncbi:MAG: zinc ribbon domain-containing protein [Chloroflexi bacterium]|nr:zinc ribbon domain-containing protein [Chloroflexota bacterium]